MRSLIDAWRFFLVVPPVSRMMTATFVVVVVMAAVAVSLDPALAPGAMRPLLLLQAFAASSGFLVPARRGHYDLLLTRGPGRLVAAGVHAGMSAAPGIVGWLVLCVEESLIVDSGSRAIGTFGSAAALFVVSGVGWALTASRPRFAGAIGWLLLRAGGGMVSANQVVDSQPLHSFAGWALHATRVLVVPETLVGIPWAASRTALAWPAVAVTAVWVCVAVRGLARANLRLETGQ